MVDRITRVTSDKQLSDALSVRQEVFVEGQDVPEELEYDDRDEAPETVHFVAYVDERPVGAARLVPYEGSDDTGKVQRVAVSETVRGEGWGRCVMDAVEAAARDVGYTRLVLDAQTHAVGFYERLDYVVTSEEEFLDAGIPHLSMAKDL
ncbi:GNAT family N-acetyltransferase [Halomarina ordinaria]|uniref:GNAT family N-acetyltransferase n=1 Tax=Halomarina ordinaria TaxID=3033939 RepID=A0ABD5U4L9_9EURY|nr:GNAT family N-acetyltransferase [Halomarina sp. PSRA2]